MLNSDFTLSQAMYECRARDDSKQILSVTKCIDLADGKPSSQVAMPKWRGGLWRRIQHKEKTPISTDFTETYIASDRRTRETTSNADYRAVIWQMDHMHEIPALIVAMTMDKG